MCYCKWIDFSFCGKAFCKEMNCFILQPFFPYFHHPLFSCQQHGRMCAAMYSYIELQTFSLNTEVSSLFHIPPTFIGIEFNHSLHTNNSLQTLVQGCSSIFHYLCCCIKLVNKSGCRARSTHCSVSIYVDTLNC